MRCIGRNYEGFAARNNFLFTIYNKFKLAALDHADLFVGMLMQPRYRSLRQFAANDGHGLSVNHLARGQSIDLFLGHLAPVVELCGLAPTWNGHIHGTTIRATLADLSALAWIVAGPATGDLAEFFR
jgi:hypothetical protein